MEGWIKLHRQSLDSTVFKNANLWRVWTYCLMRANHKGGYTDFFGGKETVLKTGQFITGRFHGSHDCHIPASTFQDQLRKLKKMGNIDITSDSNKSIITIVNWAQYQSAADASDRGSNNDPTSVRQRSDTDKKERRKEYKRDFSSKGISKELVNISKEEEGYL